ncbi:MAG: hypothetical protein ACYDH4_09985 [Candidatus Cryosericum sp.]
MARKTKTIKLSLTEEDAKRLVMAGDRSWPGLRLSELARLLVLQGIEQDEVSQAEPPHPGPSARRLRLVPPSPE